MNDELAEKLLVAARWILLESSTTGIRSTVRHSRIRDLQAVVLEIETQNAKKLEAQGGQCAFCRHPLITHLQRCGCFKMVPGHGLCPCVQFQDRIEKKSEAKVGG